MAAKKEPLNGRSGKASGSERRGIAAAESGIGDALRNVYGRALAESIPAEMMDLLGKLD